MYKTQYPETSIKTNEVLLKAVGKWLYFANPNRVIIAQKLEDVLPALREVEDLVQEKEWHAAGFVSYEAASAFDPALHTLPDEGFPFLWFGLYSNPRVVTLPSFGGGNTNRMFEAMA